MFAPYRGLFCSEPRLKMDAGNKNLSVIVLPLLFIRGQTHYLGRLLVFLHSDLQSTILYPLPMTL